MASLYHLTAEPKKSRGRGCQFHFDQSGFGGQWIHRSIGWVFNNLISKQELQELQKSTSCVHLGKEKIKHDNSKDHC